MSEAVSKKVFVQGSSLPGPELVTDWFNEDKSESAERVRFERSDAYSIYEVKSPSKGAL